MPQQIYHFKAKHSLAFAWAKFMRTKRQKYIKKGDLFQFINLEKLLCCYYEA